MRRYAEHTSDKRPMLKKFGEQLDQTSVISEDFKAVLWSYATAAIREAFEDAKQEERDRHVHPLDEDSEVWVSVKAVNLANGFQAIASGSEQSLAELGQAAFDELLEKIEVAGV